MRNGNHFIFRLILALLLTSPAAVLFFGSDVRAGNKEHVEKRVDELDRLNKQIIRQKINIPRNGSIEFKANVIGKETAGTGITITEKNILITPGREKDTTAQNSPNEDEGIEQ